MEVFRKPDHIQVLGREILLDEFGDPPDEFIVDRQEGIGGDLLLLPLPDGASELFGQALAGFQQVADAAPEHAGREGLGQIGIGTGLITFAPRLIRVLCGEEHDGNMAHLHVLLDTGTEFDAVHHRHHDVADHQVRHRLEDGGPAFGAVLGQHDGIILPQGFPDIIPDVLVVLHDDQDGFGILPRIRQRLLPGQFLPGRPSLQRDGDREDAALSGLAVHVDLPSGQLHEILDQGQADAGSLGQMVPADLVVALEDFLQFVPGDAVSRVRNAHFRSPAVLRRGKTQGNRSGRGILQGIGHQIVQDGCNNVRIEFGEDSFLHLQGDGRLPVGIGFDESPPDSFHHRTQVTVSGMDLHVLRLGLPEIQQRIDQVQEPVGVLLDDPYLGPGLLRQGRVVLQVLGRADDQGQRGPQFVGDVGIEPQTFLIGFLFHPGGRLFLLQVVPPACPRKEGGDHDSRQQQCKQGIQDQGDLRQPPGGRNPDLEEGYIAAPVIVDETGTDLEEVFSGRQLAEIQHMAVLRRIPVPAADPPGELGLVHQAEVVGSEGNEEIVLAVVQDNLFPVPQEDGLPVLFLGHGSKDAQFRKMDPGRDIPALDIPGVKDSDALGGAEAEVAVIPDGGGPVLVIARSDIVPIAEFRDFPVVPVDPADGKVGGEPDVSVPVLHQGADEFGPERRPDRKSGIHDRDRTGQVIPDQAPSGRRPHPSFPVSQQVQDHVGR